MAEKTSSKPLSKSDIVKHLASATNLSSKQVRAFFDALAELINKNLGKGSPKVSVVPGLMKIKVVHKPPVPAGMRMNPFTKEMQMFKAKPARSVVKALPLKGLKDMAAK
jgi:nucleoid DNA-binding protein